VSGTIFEAAVVGAGPAGSTAAYSLAGRGLRVLLLDRAVFPREKVCGDGLTPRAVAALDGMDVLDRLAPVSQPIDGLAITAPNGTRVAATAPPAPGVRPGRPAMLVVPRIHLDDAIRTCAVEAGAVFEGGVEVEDIARHDAGLAVRGNRRGVPVSFEARVAVVATGAAIALPRAVGVLSRAPAVMRAARAYLARRDAAAAHGPATSIEIRFADVPLPGYGWIFPVSPSTVNAGIGYFGRPRRRMPPVRSACEHFLNTIAGDDGCRGDPARPAIRSYPLRVDFPASPVWTDRVLFAGEASGLVNPLTGEGIDYALESGRIAADYAAGFLAAGARAAAPHFAATGAAYERALRQRFERLFAVCRVIRAVAAHPVLLNRLVTVAARRDDLKMALVNIVLGNREPLGASSVRVALARALFAR
jgi:geranylgeranyl reductase family protein